DGYILGEDWTRLVTGPNIAGRSTSKFPQNGLIAIPARLASPEAADAVAVEYGLVGDESQVGKKRLRDQHPVEGIAMRTRQTAGGLAVPMVDRQFEKTLTGDRRWKIRCQRRCMGQSADPEFCREFPSRGGAHENFVGRIGNCNLGVVRQRRV